MRGSWLHGRELCGFREFEVEAQKRIKKTRRAKARRKIARTGSFFPDGIRDLKAGSEFEIAEELLSMREGEKFGSRDRFVPGPLRSEIWVRLLSYTLPLI